VESPFQVLEKNKNCAESGLGTQCQPALCFKILVSASTRIRFLSAGRHCFEKLECCLAIHCGTCMGRKTDFSALPKAFLACMSEI
jgi:hypothetical protein